MCPCYRGDPEMYQKHELDGKNFISGTIFEATVGYMLDPVTKGKRFQERESSPV